MKTFNEKSKRSFQAIGLMAFTFAALKIVNVITLSWWILIVSLWFCSAATLVVVIISLMFAVFESKNL